MSELTLADLRAYYEFHNRTEGKSPKTIAWYNEVLSRFELFLARAGRSTFIKDLGEPEVREFIAYLQSRRSGPTKTMCPRGATRSFPQRASEPGTSAQGVFQPGVSGRIYRVSSAGQPEEHASPEEGCSRPY